MTYEEFKKIMLGNRRAETEELGHQCVGIVKLYSFMVWRRVLGSFGGTAAQGRVNRRRLFKGMTIVEGYPETPIPAGAIVFFRANATIRSKAPGGTNRRTIKFTSAGHVAISDYKDNDGVQRVFEQNGGRGSGTGTGSDACRLRGYWGKDAVLGFVY